MNKIRPTAVLDQTFRRIVFESPIPVIVDFWASWCAPCQILAPVLEKLAVEYEGQLLIVKAHLDDVPKWSKYFHVKAIPTMLFINQGRVIHKAVGYRGENLTRKDIEEFLYYTRSPSLKNHFLQNIKSLGQKIINIFHPSPK